MNAAWAPPRLGEGLESAELWNAVVALSGHPLPLGDQGGTAVLSLSEPPAPDAWIAEVALEGAAEPCLVQVADFPFRAMFDVELAVQDIPALPEALREALLEGMFATVRDLVGPAAARLARNGRQGVAATFPGLARSEMQWFAVALARRDGLTVELRVGCDRELAIRLLAGLRPSGTPAYEAVAQKIAAPADMTLGTITVSLRELGALEPGAVVVMAERPATVVDIRVRDVLVRFEAVEQGWRCAGPAPMARYRERPGGQVNAGGQAVSEQSGEPGAAAQEGLDVADLRIAVDFDIGRSMIPLSVLGQWQAGTVVNLDPPALDAGLEVTIRANGDVIGSGDLVRIDDRVAVRITRLLLRG